MKIVVIGAGVMGATTAYHLASAGAEVVIIDQAHEGRATAAGAGIICPWAARIPDPDWYRICSGGARSYPELIRQLAEDGEVDTSYRVVGALLLGSDSAELREVEDRLRSRQQSAPEVGAISVLPPTAARKLFPPLHPGLAAVHVAGAARVDGRRLAAGLTRAAGKRGAVLHRAQASPLIRNGEVRAVQMGADVIEADAVVFAGGAWAPELLETLGLKLAVQPQRGQILHLRLPSVQTAGWPVVLPQADHYMLAFDDSRVVVGATREAGSGFDYRVTAGGLATVLGNALAVAPGLAQASVIETRIGFRPMSADIRPFIGEVRTYPGLYIGNGLSASGLTIAPYAGKLLAELVLRGRAEIGLESYDPLRLTA